MAVDRCSSAAFRGFRLGRCAERRAPEVHNLPSTRDRGAARGFRCLAFDGGRGLAAGGARRLVRAAQPQARERVLRGPGGPHDSAFSGRRPGRTQDDRPAPFFQAAGGRIGCRSKPTPTPEWPSGLSRRSNRRWRLLPARSDGARSGLQASHPGVARSTSSTVVSPSAPSSARRCAAAACRRREPACAALSGRAPAGWPRARCR